MTLRCLFGHDWRWVWLAREDGPLRYRVSARRCRRCGKRDAAGELWGRLEAR